MCKPTASLTACALAATRRPRLAAGHWHRLCRLLDLKVRHSKRPEQSASTAAAHRQSPSLSLIDATASLRPWSRRQRTAFFAFCGAFLMVWVDGAAFFAAFSACAKQRLSNLKQVNLDHSAGRRRWIRRSPHPFEEHVHAAAVGRRLQLLPRERLHGVHDGASACCSEQPEGGCRQGECGCAGIRQISQQGLAM